MRKILLSAIIAGCAIGFGGTVFLSVENTVVGSVLFTIGLFVVCTRGLHLFTGKVCYVFDNDAAYAKALPVIWLGNLMAPRSSRSWSSLRALPLLMPARRPSAM